MWGFCVWSLFCYSLFNTHSSFGNHIDEQDRASCFTLILLLMSCDCKCSDALPDGAVGWSAVCDCVELDQTAYSLMDLLINVFLLICVYLYLPVV